MTLVDPVFFYILCRNDFASMTGGRCAAQASHATSDMHEIIAELRLEKQNLPDLNAQRDKLLEMFFEWKAQAGQFGTTIVLEAPMDTIRAVVAMAENARYLCGITHDPEYWRKDGSVAFHTPEDTCGWILIRKKEGAVLLSQFPLLGANP